MLAWVSSILKSGKIQIEVRPRDPGKDLWLWILSNVGSLDGGMMFFFFTREA